MSGIDERKILVVHLGRGIVEEAIDGGWQPPPAITRHGGILFLSTLYPHKNVEKLIRAYAILRQELPEAPRFKIVGQTYKGELQRLHELASDLRVQRYVDFSGRLDDVDLLGLLGTCQMMVFPSSAEGFGLPGVEAMQAGLPLLAAKRASLPEVFDGGVLIDPDDVIGLAETMKRVLMDPNLRKRLIEAGRRRGAKFSWSETARQTRTVILEAARGDRGRNRRGRRGRPMQAAC